MTWAFKRQIYYFFVLFLVVFIFGFLILFPQFNQPPTCTDGKQNGDESGIDCGGVCKIACTSDIDKVSVLWSRSFEIVPGRYNALAYLVNHNENLAVNKISYRFRFADENNIYIGKREGVAFIPPGGNFAIFEPGVDVGVSTKPVFTTFEFTEAPEWVIVPKEKLDEMKLSIFNVGILNETKSPILSAIVKNNSLFSTPPMDLVAILYDENHNAISTSRTRVSSLSSKEEQSINFTWPEPFSAQVVVKEIIPMYNVFLFDLK
jgi:hypothetical protein